MSIISITMLPLREHKDDIPPLLDYFIRHYNQKFRKSIQSLSREAEELLLNYNWPGNVREVKNAIERVMILAEDSRVSAKYLPIRISEGGPVSLLEEGAEMDGRVRLPSQGIPLYDVERDLIRQALEQG